MVSIRAYLPAIFAPALFLIFFSCSNQAEKKMPAAVAPAAAKHISKPGSTYNDTLIVNGAAAVFFYPDSLQLLTIKNLLDSNMYKATMHDYFYQVRYSHITIKNEWPGLKIAECKNCRYILFKKNNKTISCTDLDSNEEIYGLFVFDGKKKPLQIDMTNLETQVSVYLKN